MKNFYGILLCILMLSFWTKKSEVKMSIQSEEIEENDSFVMRNLQEGEFEEESPSSPSSPGSPGSSGSTKAPGPGEEEQPQNYHKSSGALSVGGVVGIAIAGSVVAVGALGLALAAKVGAIGAAGAAATAVGSGAGAAGVTGTTSSSIASTAGIQGELMPEFQIRPTHFNNDTLGAVAITNI